MFDYHRNYMNAKPFPNKMGFEGLSSYRIAAECNGVVLGVTAKGDCAVWDGEYHANGELRGVNNGHYFTGAGYGDDPKDLFANAFACFNEMVERTQEKDYELVFYQYNDYEDFTTDKQYSSVYAARSAGEYQLVNGTCEGFAIYNQATKKFAYEGEFPIEKYFDADVLRLNGYSVDDGLDLTGLDEHRGR